MTAFGGVFRGPRIEGVEESDESGQRGRVVGLDLERGVVRVQAARPGAPETPEPAGSPDSPEVEDPPTE